MEAEIFKALAAIGDTGTLLIAYGFYRLDKRLTVLETLYKGKANVA